MYKELMCDYLEAINPSSLELSYNNSTDIENQLLVNS